MKKLIYLLVVLFALSINAQEFKEYYVVVKEGKTIEPTTTIVQPNGFLTLNFQENQNYLQIFFENKNVIKYEKAFPTAKTPQLKRTYIVTLDNTNSLEQLRNYPEIQDIEELPKPILLYEPNDYDLTLPNSTPSSASQLDLIRAPMAWEIRDGGGVNPIIVGMTDSPVNIYHEDLMNKIVAAYGGTSTGWSHGTEVAGCIAADTNNGTGISAIGFNTRIISHSTGDQQMLILSQMPDVKVVNGSWFNRCAPNVTQQLLYDEIWNSGVLPVFAAGNGGQCGDANSFLYPASYDHVLSVTSVGHLHEYGTPYGGTNDVTIKDLHQYYDASFGAIRTHQHNSAVDICAPGYDITTTNVFGYSGGTGMNGTSFAAPIVAGAAALVYAEYPPFTTQQVYDILKSTADDIYWIPENQQFIGQLGAGRLNAYRAVLTAKCMMGNNEAHVTDLMIKDSRLDVGNEPNLNTSIFWESTDIWVRHTNDGRLYQVHQNPQYNEREPNYIYVRVTNRRCKPSSGGDKLYVNWSKSGTSQNCPQYWDGTTSLNGVALGGFIGEGTIPVLKPGQEAIIEIPWNVPNPAEYGFSMDTYNFSLLARIESNDDSLSNPLTSNIYRNVINNNNLALKNVILT